MVPYPDELQRWIKPYEFKEYRGWYDKNDPTGKLINRKVNIINYNIHDRVYDAKYKMAEEKGLESEYI
jgi:hypothetical protein